MDELKKIGAAITAGAALSGAANGALNYEPCDYSLEQGKRETCLTVEEMTAARIIDNSWGSDRTWDSL